MSPYPMNLYCDHCVSVVSPLGLLAGQASGGGPAFRRPPAALRCPRLRAKRVEAPVEAMVVVKGAAREAGILAVMMEVAKVHNSRADHLQGPHPCWLHPCAPRWS